MGPCVRIHVQQCDKIQKILFRGLWCFPGGLLYNYSSIFNALVCTGVIFHKVFFKKCIDLKIYIWVLEPKLTM